ncbi:MAG TPA: glycosyltransferase [Candidatus Sumerlaeota bacterium]|nr:glycosyltransferase [Candidatus Sumerlaeota bacterium]
MNICFFTHIYPSRAGDYKGVFVHDIAAALVRRGHAVHVVTPRRPGGPARETRDGVHVTRYRFLGWARGTQLAELNGYPPLVLGTLVVGGLWRLRRVARREHCALIHAFWIVPGGFCAALVGLLTNRPVVATAGGSDLNTFARRRLLAPLVRWTLRRIGHMIAVGSELRRIAVEHGLPADRCSVIPWILQLEAAAEPEADRAPLHPGPPGKRLLYVGNLIAPKRVDTIIRALALTLREHPDARLVLVGDGPLREKLADLATAHEVAHAVVFAGAQPHERIVDYLRQADLFVHCSDNEGLPVAISEALMMGLPVVASHVGSIPDLIREGETGYTVAPDDHAGFARHLCAILDDDALRRELSRQARAFALGYLAPDAVVERIEQVYADLL